jgi:hypothetical protein
MKKVLFLAAVALASGTLVAQEKTQKQTTLESSSRLERVGGPRDPEKTAELKVKRLDKQVTLTEEQKEKAKAIYLKTAQMRPSMDPAEKEKIAAARQEEKNAIDALLTAEQKQKLDAVAAERKARQEEAAQRRAEMSQNAGSAPTKQVLQKN